VRSPSDRKVLTERCEIWGTRICVVNLCTGSAPKVFAVVPSFWGIPKKNYRIAHEYTFCTRCGGLQKDLPRIAHEYTFVLGPAVINTHTHTPFAPGCALARRPRVSRPSAAPVRPGGRRGDETSITVTVMMHRLSPWHAGLHA